MSRFQSIPVLGSDRNQQVLGQPAVGQTEQPPLPELPSLSAYVRPPEMPRIPEEMTRVEEARNVSGIEDFGETLGQFGLNVLPGSVATAGLDLLGGIQGTVANEVARLLPRSGGRSIEEAIAYLESEADAAMAVGNGRRQLEMRSAAQSLREILDTASHRSMRESARDMTFGFGSALTGESGMGGQPLPMSREQFAAQLADPEGWGTFLGGLGGSVAMSSLMVAYPALVPTVMTTFGTMGYTGAKQTYYDIMQERGIQPDEDIAIGVGIAGGLFELGSEYIGLDVVPDAIQRKVIGDLAMAAIDGELRTATKTAARALVQAGAAATVEGLEEVLSQIGSNAAVLVGEMLTTGEVPARDEAVARITEGVGESFLGGAIAGGAQAGAMIGATMPSIEREIYKRAAQIRVERNQLGDIDGIGSVEDEVIADAAMGSNQFDFTVNGKRVNRKEAADEAARRGLNLSLEDVSSTEALNEAVKDPKKAPMARAALMRLAALNRAGMSAEDLAFSRSDIRMITGSSEAGEFNSRAARRRLAANLIDSKIPFDGVYTAREGDVLVGQAGTAVELPEQRVPQNADEELVSRLESDLNSDELRAARGGRSARIEAVSRDEISDEHRAIEAAAAARGVRVVWWKGDTGDFRVGGAQMPSEPGTVFLRHSAADEMGRDGMRDYYVGLVSHEATHSDELTDEGKADVARLLEAAIPDFSGMSFEAKRNWLGARGYNVDLLTEDNVDSELAGVLMENTETIRRSGAMSLLMGDRGRLGRALDYVRRTLTNLGMRGSEAKAVLQYLRSSIERPAGVIAESVGASPEMAAELDATTGLESRFSAGGDNLYLKSVRVIEEFSKKGAKRVNAKEFRAFLKTKGVTDEELLWTGIDDYLKGKDKVEVAGVLAVIRAPILAFAANMDTGVEIVDGTDERLAPPAPAAAAAAEEVAEPGRSYNLAATDAEERLDATLGFLADLSIEMRAARTVFNDKVALPVWEFNLSEVTPFIIVARAAGSVGVSKNLEWQLIDFEIKTANRPLDDTGATAALVMTDIVADPQDRHTVGQMREHWREAFDQLAIRLHAALNNDKAVKKIVRYAEDTPLGVDLSLGALNSEIRKQFMNLVQSRPTLDDVRGMLLDAASKHIIEAVGRDAPTISRAILQQAANESRQEQEYDYRDDYGEEEAGEKFTEFTFRGMPGWRLYNENLILMNPFVAEDGTEIFQGATAARGAGLNIPGSFAFEYISDHFDDIGVDNYVGHVRSTVREGMAFIDGELVRSDPVHLIEEVQSDLHQGGTMSPSRAVEMLKRIESSNVGYADKFTKGFFRRDQYENGVYFSQEDGVLYVYGTRVDGSRVVRDDSARVPFLDVIKDLMEMERRYRMRGAPGELRDYRDTSSWREIEKIVQSLSRGGIRGGVGGTSALDRIIDGKKLNARGDGKKVLFDFSGRRRGEGERNGYFHSALERATIYLTGFNNKIQPHGRFDVDQIMIAAAEQSDGTVRVAPISPFMFPRMHLHERDPADVPMIDLGTGVSIETISELDRESRRRVDSIFLSGVSRFPADSIPESEISEAAKFAMVRSVTEAADVSVMAPFSEMEDFVAFALKKALFHAARWTPAQMPDDIRSTSDAPNGSSDFWFVVTDGLMSHSMWGRFLSHYRSETFALMRGEFTVSRPDQSFTRRSMSSLTEIELSGRTWPSEALRNASAEQAYTWGFEGGDAFDAAEANVPELTQNRPGMMDRRIGLWNALRDRRYDDVWQYGGMVIGEVFTGPEIQETEDILRRLIGDEHYEKAMEALGRGESYTGVLEQTRVIETGLRVNYDMHAKKAMAKIAKILGVPLVTLKPSDNAHLAGLKAIRVTEEVRQKLLNTGMPMFSASRRDGTYTRSSFESLIAGQFAEYEQVPYITGATGFILESGRPVQMGEGDRWEDHRAIVGSREDLLALGVSEEAADAAGEGTRTPALLELLKIGNMIRLNVSRDSLWIEMHAASGVSSGQRSILADYVDEARPKQVMIEILRSSGSSRVIDLDRPSGSTVRDALMFSAGMTQLQFLSRHRGQLVGLDLQPASPRGFSVMANANGVSVGMTELSSGDVEAFEIVGAESGYAVRHVKDADGNVVASTVFGLNTAHAGMPLVLESLILHGLSRNPEASFTIEIDPKDDDLKAVALMYGAKFTFTKAGKIYADFTESIPQSERAAVREQGLSGFSDFRSRLQADGAEDAGLVRPDVPRADGVGGEPRGAVPGSRAVSGRAAPAAGVGDGERGAGDPVWSQVGRVALELNARSAEDIAAELDRSAWISQATSEREMAARDFFAVARQTHLAANTAVRRYRKELDKRRRKLEETDPSDAAAVRRTEKSIAGFEEKLKNAEANLQSALSELLRAIDELRVLQEPRFREIGLPWMVPQISAGVSNSMPIGEIVPGLSEASVQEVASALHAHSLNIVGSVAANDSVISNVITLSMYRELVSSMRAGGTAAEWYGKMIEATLRAWARAYPGRIGARTADMRRNREVLMIVLAVTSNGERVNANTMHTRRVMERYFETGRLFIEEKVEATDEDDVEIVDGAKKKDKMKSVQRSSAMNASFRAVMAMFELYGIDATIEKLNVRGTARKPMLAMANQIRKDLREAKAAGRIEIDAEAIDSIKFSPEIPDGYPMQFSQIFGPKIGAFYANLKGNYDILTADLWFTRTYAYYAGYLAAVNVPQIRGRVSEIQSLVDLVEGREAELSPRLTNLKPPQRRKLGIDSLSADDLRDAARAIGITPEIMRNGATFGAYVVSAGSTFTKGHGGKSFSELAFPEVGNLSPSGRAAARNILHGIKTIYEGDPIINEAPEDGVQRASMARNASRALTLYNKRADEGDRLTVAAGQAKLWYWEKDAYFAFNAGPRGEGQDYLSATKLALSDLLAATSVADGRRARFSAGISEIRRRHVGANGLDAGVRVPIVVRNSLAEVLGKMPKTASPSQIKAEIAKNASASAEARWIDLDEYLDTLGKKSVDTETVIEYARTNLPSVRDLGHVLYRPIPTMEIPEESTSFQTGDEWVIPDMLAQSISSIEADTSALIFPAELLTPEYFRYATPTAYVGEGFTRTFSKNVDLFRNVALEMNLSGTPGATPGQQFLGNVNPILAGSVTIDLRGTVARSQFDFDLLLATGAFRDSVFRPNFSNLSQIPQVVDESLVQNGVTPTTGTNAAVWNAIRDASTSRFAWKDGKLVLRTLARFEHATTAMLDFLPASTEGITEAVNFVESRSHGAVDRILGFAKVDIDIDAIIHAARRVYDRVSEDDSSGDAIRERFGVARAQGNVAGILEVLVSRVEEINRDGNLNNPASAEMRDLEIARLSLLAVLRDVDVQGELREAITSSAQDAIENELLRGEVGHVTTTVSAIFALNIWEGRVSSTTLTVVHGADYPDRLSPGEQVALLNRDPNELVARLSVMATAYRREITLPEMTGDAEYYDYSLQGDAYGVILPTFNFEDFVPRMSESDSAKLRRMHNLESDPVLTSAGLAERTFGGLTKYHEALIDGVSDEQAFRFFAALHLSDMSGRHFQDTIGQHDLIMSHVRWTAKDGSPVMYIEEVQSDLFQDSLSEFASPQDFQGKRAISGVDEVVLETYGSAMAAPPEVAPTIDGHEESGEMVEVPAGSDYRQYMPTDTSGMTGPLEFDMENGNVRAMIRTNMVEAIYSPQTRIVSMIMRNAMDGSYSVRERMIGLYEDDRFNISPIVHARMSRSIGFVVYVATDKPRFDSIESARKAARFNVYNELARLQVIKGASLPASKSWTSVSVRAAIQRAAEYGFEAVAFPSSTIHLERYGTDRLSYVANVDEETGRIKLSMAFHPYLQRVVDSEGQVEYVDQNARFGSDRDIEISPVGMLAIESESDRIAWMRAAIVRAIGGENNINRRNIGAMGGSGVKWIASELVSKWERLAGGDEISGTKMPRATGMEYFYDSNLRKTVDKIAKKHGSRVVEGEFMGKRAYIVAITPELRDAVMSGIPSFSSSNSGGWEKTDLQRAWGDIQSALDNLRAFIRRRISAFPLNALEYMENRLMVQEDEDSDLVRAFYMSRLNLFAADMDEDSKRQYESMVQDLARAVASKKTVREGIGKTKFSASKRTMRGEFWMHQDFGYPLGASDYDTFNHEMWARQAAISDMNDLLAGEPGWKAISDLVENEWTIDGELWADERTVQDAISGILGNEDADFYERLDLVGAWKDRMVEKYGKGEDRARVETMLDVALGLSEDHRKYGFVKGWVRVAGNYAELPSLTDSNVKALADGVYELIGEEALGQVFTIEAQDTRRVFVDVPFAALESGVRGLIPYRESRLSAGPSMRASNLASPDSETSESAMYLMGYDRRIQPWDTADTEAIESDARAILIEDGDGRPALREYMAYKAGNPRVDLPEFLQGYYSFAWSGLDLADESNRIAQSVKALSENRGFKKWFGKSKATADVAGQTVPLPLLHSGAVGDALDSFSTSDEAGELLNPIPFVLKLERPLELPAPSEDAPALGFTRGLPPQIAAVAYDSSLPFESRDKRTVDTRAMYSSSAMDAIATRAADLGYDGITYTDGDVRRFIPFMPAAVKAADAMVFGETKFSASRSVTFRNGFLDRARTMFQDAYIKLEKALEDLEAAHGEIPASMNPLLAIRRMPGAIANRQKTFREGTVNPLLREMGRLGLTMRDVGEILYALHAQERNAYVDRINPGHDGLGSGMSNERAARVLADMPALAARLGTDVSTIMRIVRSWQAIARETLDVQLAAGLITQFDYDNLRNAYQNYVPMYSAPAGSGPSSEREVKRFAIGGKQLRQTVGGAADNADDADFEAVIVHLVGQRELVMSRAYRNIVCNRFLELIKATPAPGLWSIFTPGRMRVMNVQSGVVEEVEDTSWRENPQIMEVLAIVPTTVRETQIVDGNPVTVERTVERGGRVLIRIEDEQLGGILTRGSVPSEHWAMIFVRTARMWSGWVRMFATSAFNPDFLLSNPVRDVQTAIATVATEQEGAGKLSKRIFQLYPGAWKAVFDAIYGREIDPKYRDQWAEFERLGARQSLFTPQDFDERYGELMAQLSNPTASRRAREAAIYAVVGFWDNLNSVMDNSIRFATYVALVESGVPKEKAAVLCRNLTVDFSKRGSETGLMTGMYAFANAGVQGTAKTLKLFRTRRGRRILGSLFAFGFIQAMLTHMLGDDDDDKNGVKDASEIREFVHDTNMVLPTGTGYAVKIPLSYGLNVPYVIGRKLYQALSGQKAVAQAIGEAVNAALASFNPLGGDGIVDSGHGFLRALAPDALDVPLDLAMGKDWRGNDLYKVSPWDKDPVLSEMGSTKTPESLRAFSRFLNRISGGDYATAGMLDFHPDAVHYLFQQLTGGTGRATERVIKTIGGAIDGDLEVSDVPGLRRFVEAYPSDVNAMSTYYLLRDQAASFEARLDRYETDRERRDAISANPRVAASIDPMKGAEKEIKKLRARLRELEARNAPESARRAIERRMMEIRNAAVRQATIRGEGR